MTQLSKSCGMLFKLKHHSTISVLKSVYLALFHSYLTYSIFNWGRANKNTLLPLIRLQIKAVRTVEYDKTKKNCTLFQAQTSYQIYLNCQLTNSCTYFVMVDYQITLITTLLRLYQSRDIKKGLLHRKNIV